MTSKVTLPKRPVMAHTLQIRVSAEMLKGIIAGAAIRHTDVSGYVRQAIERMNKLDKGAK